MYSSEVVPERRGARHITPVPFPMTAYYIPEAWGRKWDLSPRL